MIWNLPFDELLNMFLTGPVKIRGFADDACLLIKGIDKRTIMSIAQKAVDQVTQWGTSNGLTFGAAKTVVVLFNTRHKDESLVLLTVDGLEIPFSDSSTYLGIELHKKLSFSSHIPAKCKKAKRLLTKLKQRIGQLWGPHPS